MAGYSLEYTKEKMKTRGRQIIELDHSVCRKNDLLLGEQTAKTTPIQEWQKKDQNDRGSRIFYMTSEWSL